MATTLRKINTTSKPEGSQLVWCRAKGCPKTEYYVYKTPCQRWFLRTETESGPRIAVEELFISRSDFNRLVERYPNGEFV